MQAEAPFSLPAQASAGKNQYRLLAQQFFQISQCSNLRCHIRHPAPEHSLAAAAVTFARPFVATACQYWLTADDSTDRIAERSARTFRAPAERDPVLNSSQFQLSPWSAGNGCRGVAIGL